MSGYLVSWVPAFGLFTERLARTGLCDFVEGVRVAERRVFIARVLRVGKTKNYTNLHERGQRGLKLLYKL
jgi:hypothetical protein